MPILTYAHHLALKAIRDGRGSITANAAFAIDGQTVGRDEQAPLDDLWADDLIEAGPEWPDADAPLKLTSDGEKHLAELDTARQAPDHTEEKP